MPGFVARGTLIGRDLGAVWIDANGAVSADPVDDADALPGRFVLAGLVDAHAHPAMFAAASGPAARSLEETEAELDRWGAGGVTYARDVGSPRGVTLEVSMQPGRPLVQAAGRFFAPAGRYFPGMADGVEPEDLAEQVRVEISRGARWIKIVGDFPVRLEPGFTPEPTYDLEAIRTVCETAHAHGARVAVHSTIGTVDEIVRAGADTIEHGRAIGTGTLEQMRARGTAWVPTLCALFASLSAGEDAARRVAEEEERLGALLRIAVASGVPVLTGSDVVGAIPDEIALFVRLGLSPIDALDAATTAGYRLLELDPWAPGSRANLVTYDRDPRHDPEVLRDPAAVVVSGRRVR